MACAICMPSIYNISNEQDDCVVKYLAKIKSHFDYFQSQLESLQEANKGLQEANKGLQAANAELTKCLEITRSNSKRRKTRSFEDSTSLLESTNDNLNDAINCDTSVWDDSTFFQPSQPPPKTTPDKILKPHNELPPTPVTDLRRSSPVQVLPRRLSMKTSLSTTKPRKSVAPSSPADAENRKPKWNSKENLKSSAQKRNEWHMSFIQPSALQKKRTPIKEKKSSPLKEEKCSPARRKPCSPVREKKSSPVSEKNTCSVKKTSPPVIQRLGVKSEVNLKQTRLRFSVKQEECTIPDSDETFCEDFITPSPTSFGLNSDENSKARPRTLRKYIRNKQQQSNVSPTLIESNSKIKAEPSTVKKVLNLDSKPKVAHSKDRNITPTLESFNLSGIEAQSDNSSLFILPSQPDDVIIVDESDDIASDFNIDSAALIDEMMMKSDETSDFLKNIENQCILNSKNLNDKKNEMKTASRIVQKWNCKECESYYRIAGRDLSDKELLKRMERCAMQHRPECPQTPEGFWNPFFAPTQEDDPRNITYIDTRRIDKKTSN